MNTICVMKAQVKMGSSEIIWRRGISSCSCLFQRIKQTGKVFFFFSFLNSCSYFVSNKFMTAVSFCEFFISFFAAVCHTFW